MIRTRKFILLICVLLLALCCFVSCNKNKVDSIRFDQTPRTVYVQGQDIDLSGTTVLAVSGNKTEKLDTSAITVSGYDKNILGKQTVTFAYGDVSTTLDVTVIPRIEVEGAVKDYFVGDVFDQSKGRIRVANDLGVVSTVALNDAGVSISGFDSSKAATALDVTVGYGGYTGSISVNVYAVSKIELSQAPTKTEYGSHETVFDVTGAYFTVSADGVDFERYVELNQNMIKGFDPSLATIENVDNALKQKVTISYLGHEVEFEISVKFSGVSLVQLRAKELASITDFTNIPADKGELALDAMRAFMKLDNAGKEAVADNDKNLVAKIAAIYGYELFLEAKDTFSDTVELSAVEQDSGEVIGMFKIIASGYDTTLRDLERLKKSDEPMIELGEILQSIKTRFADLEIADSKKAKDYLELIYTADGLDAAVDILTLMTDLHKELASVKVDWKAEELEAYKSNIKTAVVIISGSEFNPFKAPPYLEVFQLLSKWREKDDYFDIIYAYYLKYERSAVVDSLWQNIPMPEKLQTIHTMLVNAANETANIKVGGDLTSFLYCYNEACKCAEEILNSGNQLHIEIYNALEIERLINAYIFTGSQMNNIGYVYYVTSMAENEKFEKIMDKYLNIVYGKTYIEDFSDPVLHSSIREIVEMYADFTPAEQYAFISALYCDYRYNKFDSYLFECTINEKDDVRATSLFTYVIAKTYREVLSEAAWDVFTRTLTASEVYALGLRDESEKENFKEMMQAIVADAAKLSATEKESFAKLLDKMTALYNECLTPSVPDTGSHDALFTELLGLIDKFFEISEAMNDTSLTVTDRSSMSTLWLAIAEKAKNLENEILASGDDKLINTYLHCTYSFDTDGDGSIGDNDVKSTVNYVMDEIRAVQADMLVSMSLADPRNAKTIYNGYELFFNCDIGDFLVKSLDIMYASFKKNAETLDREYVIKTLNELRSLLKRDKFAFMMFNANLYFYEGVCACLSAGSTDELADVITTLMHAEEQYIIYESTYDSKNPSASEDNRAQFCNTMKLLVEKYDALADKTLLAELTNMYNHYVELYNTLK